MESDEQSFRAQLPRAIRSAIATFHAQSARDPEFPSELNPPATSGSRSGVGIFLRHNTEINPFKNVRSIPAEGVQALRPSNTPDLTAPELSFGDATYSLNEDTVFHDPFINYDTSLADIPAIGEVDNDDFIQAFLDFNEVDQQIQPN